MNDPQFCQVIGCKNPAFGVASKQGKPYVVRLYGMEVYLCRQHIQGTFTDWKAELREANPDYKGR